jgi:hypothetical protein
MLHVKHAQGCLRTESLDGAKGEEGMMLVVDVVKLGTEQQMWQVLHLEDEGAIGCQQRHHATHQVHRIGHMRHHIIGKNEAGLPVLPDERRRELAGKGGDLGGNAGGDRRGGRWQCRVNAQHLAAGVFEMPEQFAIIAGDLHGEGRKGGEARQQLGGIVGKVGDGGRGRTGVEAIVLAKEQGRIDGGHQLHEVTVGADPHVQGIAFLWLVRRGEEAVGQGCCAQMHERQEGAAMADTTGKAGGEMVLHRV